MYSIRQKRAIWLCLCVGALFGTSLPAAAQDQPPAPSGQSQPGEAAPPQGGLPSTKPLTPVEQRDKDIRVYDPLDRTDPNLDNEGTSQSQPSSGGNAGALQTPARQSAASAPLPGSVAASNQVVPANPRNEGPQVISEDADSAAVQEYTGPAVLSRSYTLARPMTPKQIKWSWTIGGTAIYGNGLNGGAVSPNGTLDNVAAFGSAARWTFNGRHFWKRDQIGVNYSGDYSHYNGNSGYNGQNENLNLDFTHEFSRHISMNLIESGSILAQSYALENPQGSADFSVANINLAASPTVQILGYGVRQTNTQTHLIWQKSARLSFTYGGGFFVVQQTGAALVGTTGYQAQTDVNYRYTRKMTVGAYYSFSNYVYTQHVAVSDANTFGGIFSYAFTRTAQVRLRAGVTQSENNGLVAVPIDPTIAALIGRNSVIIDSYQVSLFSDISAQAIKDFGRNRTVNVSYAHGLAPGNGLILTSIQQTISAGGSMRMFRRYTAGASLGRTTLSSQAQGIGTYTTNYVSFSVSRPYQHGLTGTFGFDYRTFRFADGPPTLQSQFRITSGLSWGPGEGRLW